MRASTRNRLAPLFIAAAILATGLSAHQVVGMATHHRAAIEVEQICPNGTNWDDNLQECV